MDAIRYSIVTTGGFSIRRISFIISLFALCLLILMTADSWSQEFTSIPGRDVSKLNILDPEFFSLGAAADHSFYAPASWAQELTNNQGWGPENPRILSDVNGDGMQDIVGFGNDGVWLATSTQTRFNPAFVLADFGYQSGWRAERHVRALGDINGDKMEDIVGFGDAGVYRALSTGTGFSTVTFVVAEFGYDQGWRNEEHVRLLADVNGDGLKDIVGFGDDGVWLSLATSSGFFTEPAFVLADLGSNQGWTPEKHIRTTADINGDGRQDIVGFGDDGVWIALSNGSGFDSPQFVLSNFGFNAGSWRLDRHIRLLADINGDNKQDIVAFGDDGVWIARSTGIGFEEAQYILDNFGYEQGWRIGLHPRYVADLNGDGYQDIVGFGQDLVYRSLGGPEGFAAMRGMLRDMIPGIGYPWNSALETLTNYYPRLVGDVNGDGMNDLIAFGRADILVARSSNLSPPSPPAAPSNPRVTGSTTSSLSIAWNDNSNDERNFFINYGAPGSLTKQNTVGADAKTHVLRSLDSDTRYCFTIQAENLWGFSPETSISCGRTKEEQTTPPPSSRSISVSKEGSGPSTIFIINGSGFTPNSLVVIRITDRSFNQVQFPETAGSDGKFVSRHSVPCLSGIQLTFTAFEDADPQGTFANAIVTTCP